MRKASTQADPDPIVVCIEGHMSPAGAARRGDRLRASDPRVAAAPVYFAPDIADGEETDHATGP